MLFIKNKIILAILILIIIGGGYLLLRPARTVPILGADGQVQENSITEIEKINLGGVDQWLVIRGRNKNNPIILMLSGGPGASEMGRFLRFNRRLEDEFIVVNWEQRGTGKSYPAIRDEAGMTVEQYVEDINELTEYLQHRFDQEKIYLLGHSWGTIIGTKAVQKYPDKFHAYIGAAQMVNIVETDRYMYNYVLKAAERSGDDKVVRQLNEAGEPPYYGDDMLGKYRPFLTNYADYYRAENLFNEANREWYTLSSMVMLDEYTLLDKVRYFRGLLDTFPLVYQQIQDLNFIEQAAKLEVPAYYMIGKHDYTALFIEDYYEVLEAPEKGLFWFENSAHGEIWTEADKFHDLVINKILPETYQIQ